MAGIYLASKLQPESTRLLRHYVKGLPMPSGVRPIANGELHATIMYCKRPLNPGVTWQNYVTDPTPAFGFAYQLRYIGKALAIILEARWLRERFAHAKIMGLRSDFAGFIPHISLFYDPPLNLPIGLWPQPWQLPIGFTGEYSDKLDD